MGNVQFVYNAQKGAHTPGSAITNGKDAFQLILENRYGDVQAMYNACSQAEKDEILQIFGGKNVFEDSAALENWMSDFDGDDEGLDEPFEKIKPWLNR